jgi:hypothetical protein
MHKLILTFTSLMVAVFLLSGVGFAAAPVNLTSEEATLDGFGNDIGSFSKIAADLFKRPEITAVDVQSAQRSADSAKRRLSQVQQALQSSIDKLKAAGLWDKLDTALAAGTTDKSGFAVIVNAGGARKVLEDAVATAKIGDVELNGVINSLVAKEAKKLTPVGSATLGCRIARARYTLSTAILGTASQRAAGAAHDACRDATYDPFK